jgi:microcystin degradation protein MlrC
VARILVGAFSMEANTFAPGETTLDDFRAQALHIGGGVHRDVLGPESELAGAWDVLTAAGHEPVPSLAAWSSPRAPLARGVVAELERLLLAACDRVDGAYLMLHGACVAHDEDDPEGVLLEALRDRLGPGRPIAVSLDCHAHFTPRMAVSADAAAAYRTCPHVDTRRTGEQAARVLVSTLAGHVHPVLAVAARPMITPPDVHDSSRDPFRRLMALNDEAEQSGALASALLPVQPWIDVPGLGWKVVVTGDGDREAAQRLAERIADEAWDERHGFLAGRRLPVDEALDVALAGPAPYVVADAGDATNGGSVGDSTELLRAVLRRGDARVLLSVRDPVAAGAAYRAGAGASFAASLGSGPPGAYNERAGLEAEVVSVFDGDVVYSHPVNRGYRSATGPAAVLRRGRLHVVVHTRSLGVIDPALYEAFGIDPASFDVVQAKSHVSYRAGFAPLTTRSVVADTGGPTTANLALLPYRRRPRPLFPFEEP